MYNLHRQHTKDEQRAAIELFNKDNTRLRVLIASPKIFRGPNPIYCDIGLFIGSPTSMSDFLDIVAHTSPELPTETGDWTILKSVGTYDEVHDRFMWAAFLEDCAHLRDKHPLDLIRFFDDVRQHLGLDFSPYIYQVLAVPAGFHRDPVLLKLSKVLSCVGHVCSL